MRLLRIIWALPNTLIGLALVPIALPRGGRVRLNRGAIELNGPAVAWMLRYLVPIRGGARAMTLGHVVLGRDDTCLAECGEHERVHVRQYERWGPLFLPAYFASSIAAVLRGEDAYLGNRFEREAYGLVADSDGGLSKGSRGKPAADEPPIRVFLAFAAIYVIWGSTYLAIRFAVETLPPFMMLAARFGVAGLLLYGWLRLRGMSRPPGREWAGSAAVGGLLLVGGTGAVAWAEQWIPSGLAALIVTIVPVWMVLLDWARPGGRRPTAPVIAGLVLGFAGVALLIGPVELGGGGKMQYLGAAAVLGGTISWATGSVLGAAFPLPSAPRMAAALQMTMGGLLLLILGTVVGEWSRLDPAGVSQRSLMSLVYLIVFGSIVAFAAYVYLLKVSTPARVGSYAYVNPVVAVFLGWALADEPVTLRTLAAAAIIITGVVLIVSRRQPKTLLESGTTGDPEPGALGLSLSDPVDSGDTDLMKRPPPRRRVLLAELERRSVFRASAVYGAASFVILEALRVWAPHIGLPSGALRAIATLVLIGFPVALWLAWHYEITGDGVDRTDDASSGEIRRRAGQPRARRWAPTVLGGIGVLLLAGSAAQIFFS